MNTIETIRSEVERRKKEWESLSESYSEDMDADAMVAEYESILSFLSTLQEKSEKPINPKERHFGPPNWYPHPLEEQPVCEELDDAIDNYVIDHQFDFDTATYDGALFREEDMRETARHFYELGRQSKPEDKQ